MLNDGIGVEQTGENEMNGIDIKFLKRFPLWIHLLKSYQLSSSVGLLLMAAIFSPIKGENHKMKMDDLKKKWLNQQKFFSLIEYCNYSGTYELMQNYE